MARRHGANSAMLGVAMALAATDVPATCVVARIVGDSIVVAADSKSRILDGTERGACKVRVGTCGRFVAHAGVVLVKEPDWLDAAVRTVCEADTLVHAAQSLAVQRAAQLEAYFVMPAAPGLAEDLRENAARPVEIIVGGFHAGRPRLIVVKVRWKGETGLSLAKPDLPAEFRVSGAIGSVDTFQDNRAWEGVWVAHGDSPCRAAIALVNMEGEDYAQGVGGPVACLQLYSCGPSWRVPGVCARSTSQPTP